MMQELIQEIIEKNPDKDTLNNIKLRYGKKYKINFPKDSDILSYANHNNIDKLKVILKRKPIRLSSGVATISLFTVPRKCNHGICTFCPGGPNSIFGNVPQSYTGTEPATRRAIRNDYDPYLQVFNRLEQYILNGYFNPEKVEIIIQGGTFPSYPEAYRKEFTMYMFKAMNDFSNLFYENNELNFNKFKEFFMLPRNINDTKKALDVKKRILDLKNSSTLELEQEKNELSIIRCALLCIETKPDCCFEIHINDMLDLGATRIELGLQTIYDNILKITNRGHNNQDSIKAIQLSKDSFLKTGLHVMPGLQESNFDLDVNVFKELFNNQDYMPDSLKIYPCLVMKGTSLYKQWLLGKYKPLTTEEAASIIIEGKKYVKKFCRIMRINRDIPTNMTDAGVDITNLRQYIQEKMKKENIKCSCIRCHEPMNKQISFEYLKLLRYDYESSNSQEIFLSLEDVKNYIIVAFLRLRIPYKPFRKEITNNSAGIRELHIYSNSVALGQKPSENEMQHRGFGKMLMNEAEKIAQEEFNIKKMLVISGIGVKEYYKNKLGYKKDGIYMSKLI